MSKKIVVSKPARVEKVKTGPVPDYTPAFRLAAPLPRQRTAKRPSNVGMAFAMAGLEKVASKEVDHSARAIIRRISANLEDGVGAVRG